MALLRARTEGKASPGRSWPEIMAFFAAKATCSCTGIPDCRVNRKGIMTRLPGRPSLQTASQVYCITCDTKIKEGKWVPLSLGYRFARQRRLRRMGRPTTRSGGRLSQGDTQRSRAERRTPRRETTKMDSDRCTGVFFASRSSEQEAVLRRSPV